MPRLLPMFLICLFASTAFAEGNAHADPSVPLLLSLSLCFLAAIVGGEIAVRLKQPAVLGELLVGVLLGNFELLGLPSLDWLAQDATLDLLARVGVVLLLFGVGLESTVRQMLSVGLSSLLVGVIGVIFPFVLGWGVSTVLLPDHGFYVHLFIGATLTATSVGITARVLEDLGASKRPEARIILGAAVIDDVLGLVILAVVGALIASADKGTAISWLSLGGILLKAVVFLVGSLVLGLAFSPKLFSLASRLHRSGVLLFVGLSFCFLMSVLANWIGLAAIVGAFAAGLILEDTHYRDFTTRGELPLETLIKPVSAFFVPIFFLQMGMKTDLAAFVSPGVPLLALSLTVVAILGKQACAFGVREKSIHRWQVALGMIPRGEVGLIFASIGSTLTVKGEPMVSAQTFSAIVVMVLLTTLVTPPLLAWSIGKQKEEPAE